MSGLNDLLYWRPKSFSPEKTERTTKKEHEAMIKTKTAIELIILTTCSLLLEKKIFQRNK